MKAKDIKLKLKIDDITSLLEWQKFMHPRLEYVFDNFNEDDFDEYMDLYDFIMSQIAWYFINSKM